MQETPQTTLQAPKLAQCQQQLHKVQQFSDLCFGFNVWHCCLNRAIQKLALCANGGGLEPSQQHSSCWLSEQFPNSHAGQQWPLNHLLSSPPTMHLWQIPGCYNVYKEVSKEVDAFMSSTVLSLSVSQLIATISGWPLYPIDTDTVSAFVLLSRVCQLLVNTIIDCLCV